jgi:hypothetical protein
VPLFQRGLGNFEFDDFSGIYGRGTDLIYSPKLSNPAVSVPTLDFRHHKPTPFGSNHLSPLKIGFNGDKLID